MIFILVSLIFYLLTAVRGEMPYVVRRIAYTYAHAYCARELNGSCDVYVQSTIKWRRSKRKSPRWTWILLSEGQIYTTILYYRHITHENKAVKIIVFRPLIWAVERLKKKKMEKIAVWPISVYTASDGF